MNFTCTILGNFGIPCHRICCLLHIHFDQHKKFQYRLICIHVGKHIWNFREYFCRFLVLDIILVAQDIHLCPYIDHPFVGILLDKHIRTIPMCSRIRIDKDDFPLNIHPDPDKSYHRCSRRSLEDKNMWNYPKYLYIDVRKVLAFDGTHLHQGNFCFLRLGLVWIRDRKYIWKIRRSYSNKAMWKKYEIYSFW